MRLAGFASLSCATIVAHGAAAFAYPPRTVPAGGLSGADVLIQDKDPLQSPDKRPQVPINTLKEVFAAVQACWIPPNLDQARPGMEITVLVSFTRNGELLGHPRITYETPAASQDEQLAYRIAMAEALRRCNPLPFTAALGNALAGRPLTIRFIDNRKLKQAENVHG